MAHWATYIKLLRLELIYFKEEDVRFESRRITIQFVQKFTTGLPLELELARPLLSIPQLASEML